MQRPCEKMTSSTELPTTVFLWILPRTCSTVLAKCLSFVDGAQIWIEPYCASFANQTLHNPEFKKGDPNVERARSKMAEFEATEMMNVVRQEIKDQLTLSPNLIDQKEISYSWTKKQLETPEPGTKFVIVKEESFAAVDHLEYLPDVPNCRHVFLIRHPREVYFSLKNLFSKRLREEKLVSWEDFHVASVSMYVPIQTIFQKHYRHWQNIRSNAEFEPVVMDAFDFTTRPREILTKLFAKLGIPFEERYLEWDGSDEVITKTWKGSADWVLLKPRTAVFSRAAKSTRFEAPKQHRGTVSDSDSMIIPEMRKYVEDAMPFYEDMYAHRIK